MSNARKFAELELDILSKSNVNFENTSLVRDFIPEIIALVDKFGKSGQSGFSAPSTAHALSRVIEKLCLQEPILPILGIDEEWVDVSDISDEPMWQNKRCSGLFKYSNGDIKYVDAIVKKTQNGTTWSGGFWLNKNDYLKNKKDLKIQNKQSIRGFPFVPKTFYVDVIEEEVAPDDWEMYLKDRKQLDEVFEYYKPKDISRKVLVEKINNSLL